MTEEIRPICLYIETCLDKKEGTRDCAKCEHHLNYWTEVMIRDMEKNITRLEQENKELKEENIKVKKEFNNLIAEIISDIEYTGEIACNGESPKEHLKKCQKALKALEEIKAMVTSPYPGEPRNVLNIINEVLNDI